MSSRDTKDLTSELQTKAIKVIEYCNSRGVDLLVYCTLRTLEEQAKLYRQSRSWTEVRNKLIKFRERGLGFLADILFSIGPCNGPYVTDAAPGESWHNYREAWDAVPLVGGKPLWGYKGSEKEWNIYGEGIRSVNMNWAGDWVSFIEYPHAQLRSSSNPLKVYTPDIIHNILGLD